MPAPTRQQQRAIDATGDVLVMAGAGAGKTSTLVARILHRVVDAQPRVPLDRLLVVTFNEAAANEMRHRLAMAFEQRGAAAPDDVWIAEQGALLDTALVSTLHAFCLRLIREHFHELGLDPQFSIQDDLQSALQCQEALDSVLHGHYAGTAPESAQVQAFLRRHARDGDRGLRELVLRVHDYARSLPDPEGWLQSQVDAFEAARPTLWRERLVDGIAEWASFWREAAERQGELDPQNFAATESYTALTHLRQSTGAGIAAGLAALLAAGDRARFARGTPGAGKLGRWREPLERLFDEAAELQALLVPAQSGAVDPLQEDWDWARPDALALLVLVRQVYDTFAAARRAAAGLDFSDLEQLALRLLWDPARREPTPLAQRWRERLEWVFVDEYQDINRAQDRILECVSRTGAAANRFYVGDVKQSIYRFRRANPGIFRRYAAAWREGPGRSVIPLVENFRSHEAILGFVNALFDGLMRSAVGGVEYDAEARLVFGAPEARSPLRERPQARVEFHLVVAEAAGEGDEGAEGAEGAGDSGDASTEAGNGGLELDVEEWQAAVAARRVREFVERGETIWDASLQALRPVTWSDIAVLHPAPNPVAERWARQFAAAAIPFEARRSGFFAALEVSDLISLARLLDNPLQDLPALAVFRSPLVGLTLDELAVLRLLRRSGTIWEAAEACAAGTVGIRGAEDDGALRAAAVSTRARLEWFMERFRSWRRLAREGSLVRCLEAILADTSYDAWLRAQPRADARLANVRQLLALARQFDQFQRTGLYRFLQFIDAQAAAGREPDIPAVASGNAVRFLSVHQSKGLEFPIVIVAGLGRRFNRGDLHGEWLLDEDFGLCPPVLPPDRVRGYASVARWVAVHRQRNDAAGEQIRLFYVAVTRAAERLVLLGSTRASRLADWVDPSARFTTYDLVRAPDVLAWLGPKIPTLTGRPDWANEDQGTGRQLDWQLHRTRPAGVTNPDPGAGAVPAVDLSLVDAATVAAVRDRLTWSYPWLAATREPAKSAVTALRRRWLADEEAAEMTDDEAAPPRSPRGLKSTPASVEAVARGEAHHLFFELIDLAAAGSRSEVEAERDRLRREGWLTPTQAEVLDLDGVAAFWSSEIGQAVRRAAAEVQREVPFTARLRPAEIARLRAGRMPAGFADDDFAVIQGVADLLVVRPEELWLVDYKTDRVAGRELLERAEKYRTQLELYAHALTAIHRRPVTRRGLWFVHARQWISLDAADGRSAAAGPDVNWGAGGDGVSDRGRRV